MSAKNTSSGASTAGSKVSIFAAKSGFVIPKNKLSGSLVPIFRGGKKPGGNGASNDESTNQVIRKSKWGPDPMQDAAVRKGRALAYQTRVDQIMQQLKSGILEPWETQDTQLADQPAEPKSSTPQIDFKDSELLKLERREIIGEILKLNPSFKAPPDYQPLLKEATVPIPVKDHPGYNFIGLIFGPGGETQKRLEKETKAKIQVFGTKANAGEKVEISASDGSETQVAYEELNVRVSADTFEKVDGAVALIELLLTSASGNLSAGNNQNAQNQSQDTSIPSMAPSGDQGVEQSVVGSTQTPLQGHFEYQGQGFSAISAYPIQSFSAPINSLPVHSSPLNPISMPSLFGPRPIAAPGFSTSLVPSWPQIPMQVPSHPFPLRNFRMPALQPSSAQAYILASLPSTANQHPPALPSPVAGSLVSSLPLPVSGVPPGPQSDRALTPVGSSSGWSAASASVPASLGPGKIGQIPAMTSLQGPQPVIPQPGFLTSTPPSNTPAANAVSTVSFSSGPSTVNVPKNHPTEALSFASVPPPQAGFSSAPLIKSPPVVTIRVTSTSQPTLQSGIIGSFPGNTANPTLIRPPTIATSKPLQPGVGDFTFKPHHMQNPASFPRPSNQPVNQENPLLRPPVQTPSPQAPSFRVAVNNTIPSSGMHVLPRPQVGNQMGQTHAHMSVTFPGNSTGTSVPSRVPAFFNANPVIPPTRSFNAVPQRPNLAGPFPPMPWNPQQGRQNYPAPVTPPGNFTAPNQQTSINPSFASNPGGQQIYDPFSPTSIPIMPQQQAGDLMKGMKMGN